MMIDIKKMAVIESEHMTYNVGANMVTGNGNDVIGLHSLHHPTQMMTMGSKNNPLYAYAS